MSSTIKGLNLFQSSSRLDGEQNSNIIANNILICTVCLVVDNLQVFFPIVNRFPTAEVFDMLLYTFHKFGHRLYASPEIKLAHEHL